MALADIVLKKKKIKFNGGSVEVHGLTLSDISTLINYDKKSAESLIQGKDLNGLITQAPEFVARLISLACDEGEEGVELALRLPVGVQFEILVQVWELSQINDETLGNVLAAVLHRLKNLNLALPSGSES